MSTFNFNQPQQQQQQQSAFGTSNTFNTAAPTPFSFGSTQPAAAPAFSFGAAPPASTSFQLGTSAAPAPTFGGFGQQQQVSAAPSAFNVSSSAPLSFGAPATTSTASSFGGFGGIGGFGTSTTNTGFGFGATSSAPQTGLTTSVISTTPSLGLGGINSTPFGNDLAASASQGKTDSKAYNEMPVPNPIELSVQEFKKHVKEQKTKKEEVSRGSSKALDKVGEEVETLKNILSTLANNIQHHSSLVYKLKHDAAIEIRNAEIAQRTKETAPSMQLDNVAPLEYFLHLVTDFEQRMQFYKQQIEDTERNLLAMSKQHSLTPQELMGTMKKLHEAFMLLAGRVHTVHTALQNYKEDYLTHRRRVLGDPSDIFASSKGHASAKSAVVSQLNKIGSGPFPFGGSSALSRTLNHLNSTVQQGGGGGGGSTGSGVGGVNFNSSSLSNSNSVLSGINPGNLSFGNTPARSTGFFGSPAQSLLPSASSSFQLQSPPPGNKRNKR